MFVSQWIHIHDVHAVFTARVMDCRVYHISSVFATLDKYRVGCFRVLNTMPWQYSTIYIYIYILHLCLKGQFTPIHISVTCSAIRQSRLLEISAI